MTAHQRLLHLLEKVRQGAAQKEDYAALKALINEDESGEVLAQVNDFHAQTPGAPDAPAYDFSYWHEVAQKVISVDKAETPVRQMRPYRKWLWAAASVMLIIAAAAAFVLSPGRRAVMPARPAADIQPGHQGAVLTLADGTQIALDQVQDSIVAIQGGAMARVVSGTLAYEYSGDEEGAVSYNIMSTPKGREFKIVLPDGTQVWLNAASSIRYPTRFTGGERLVFITGEAYFEVTQHAGMPFRVNVNDKTTVEVLGTNFNINAYDNEADISTTLIDGSIRVAAAVLKPGQQARMANTGARKVRIIEHADIEKAMAWKHGLFNFKNTTLEEVMRQLERWYNIDVIYEKGVPDVELVGEMTKGVPLSGLLKNLEEFGIHYKLEGRKLTILPSKKLPS